MRAWVMTHYLAWAYSRETSYRAEANTGREVMRMGCLFALFGGLFPRLALLILWIARPALVDAAFNTFILPLLGIIFLPFTTLIYVIVYVPGVGLTGWGFIWVIIALLLDIGHWGVGYTQRDQLPGRS